MNVDLVNNELVLPPSIGQLGRLRTLHLGKNQLTTLPETFGELIALEDCGLEKQQADEVTGDFRLPPFIGVLEAA